MAQDEQIWLILLYPRNKCSRFHVYAQARQLLYVYITVNIANAYPWSTPWSDFQSHS